VIAGRGALRALATLAAAVPALAAALEPRFDHRDEHGITVETLVAHDTVAVSGRATRSAWRPSLRLAWGFDASGEGDELLLGVQGALRSWDDPDDQRVSLGLDARYRAYFGTEELKTFFDLGLWAPVLSRLAVGPLVGLGVAYDFSRSGGVYVSGAFATGFGQARVATFSASAGAQLRFE
jgi:hypothetical protein